MSRIILLLLTIIFCASVHSGEFAVAPMVINIEGEKNKPIPFEFTVKAKKSGKVVLKIYDLNQVETGHMGFMEGDSSNKSSKAHWIKIKENKFALKSGDYRVAKGTIKIPSRARGQHLAAIMVEEVQSEEEKKGISVNVRYAVVLKINTDNGKKRRTRTKTKFEDLSFRKVEEGWEFEGYFKNLSKVEGHLNTELQLRSKDRRLVGRLQLKTLSAWQRNEDASMVYPGSRVKVFGVLPKNIVEGTYQIRIKNTFNRRNQPVFRHEITLSEQGNTSPDQAEVKGLAGS
ncbi:MAG: hypothetical protein RPR40_00745 [Bermanella sp.]